MPLTHEQAVVIASQAGDEFIQAANRAGRAVMYDAEGRNAVSHAALMALESVEPGRWRVTTTDLDDARQAQLLVTLREPERVTVALGGRNTFQPKHGTNERLDTCDCVDCRRAAGRPIAPALRRELAALLRTATAKAEEWANAADREWAPHAPDYHDGDGTVTAAIEAPYVEHRLARAWRGKVQQMADNLSADETP